MQRLSGNVVYGLSSMTAVASTQRSLGEPIHELSQAKDGQWALIVTRGDRVVLFHLLTPEKARDWLVVRIEWEWATGIVEALSRHFPGLLVIA